MMQRQPLRLQFVSDLHLEFPSRPEPKISRDAPYIALLGDVGYPAQERYKNFVTRLSAQFEQVFIIPGNHEYYKTTMSRAKAEMLDLCKTLKNVTLLDPGSVKIGDVRILGATLWSYVPPKHAPAVAAYINDYHLTHKDNGEQLTIEDTNRMHAEELAWLTSELYKAKDAGEKTLVVTHHAPIIEGTSHPRYIGKPTNCAFATDLSSLFPYVDYWLHGHTHYNHTTRVGNTTISANQLGYNSEESQGFDPSRVIEI
jgi:DNA repair exonuclease SbcCD nuclease subunit